jgi:lipid-binding SYLF domain-containing protein
MAPKSRPNDRTSMRGMIYNANQVLDRAFSDNINNTIPKGLFEKARGIAIISSIEAGFVFSGNLGTGIVILVKDEDGEWSPPSAIGLTGMGWGLLIGVSLKDIVLFLFDDLTVDTLAGDVGLKFGAQGELTVGPFGRAADISVNLSKNGGVGSTFALAHTSFRWSFSRRRPSWMP